MSLSQIKNLELDKICRVCLAAKKDMRPLFGEMVADMLMECARVQIDNTDGWPDKICIQCVHQVSRCHAFKTRVEKSDQELRTYIKGLTVIVEEPVTQIELSHQNAQQQHHHHSQPQQQHVQHQQHVQQQHVQQQSQTRTRNIVTTPAITQPAVVKADMSDRQQIRPTQIHQLNRQQIQEIQLNSRPIQSAENSSHQIVLPNGMQVLNGAQLLTTTTHNGQQITQLINANQIGQLIQTGGTVQMIQQNGQAQVLQIQRTADDRCEIIVQQPDMSEAQYYEDVTITQSSEEEPTDQMDQGEDIIQIRDEEEIEELEEEEEQITGEEMTFTLEMSNDESDTDEKMYLEFISLQTSCPSPGRYVCNLCRKEFKHSRWLQTHMKSHSNWIKANCKRQPQCEICGRSFKGPGMLKMHMKTHEVKILDKLPTCNVCHKEFKSKTILYRHRQVHQTRAYQCGNCFRSFASSYTLTSHMNTKHSAEDLKFICAHCSHVFTTIESLKSHIQKAGHGKSQIAKLE